MILKIKAQNCQKGFALPLLSKNQFPGMTGHILANDSPASLEVGAVLFSSEDNALFKVTGHIWIPPLLKKADLIHTPACHCPLLQAFEDITQGTMELNLKKSGWSLAVITLSDKGSIGERQDISGPMIIKMLNEVLPTCANSLFLIPDEADILRSLLGRLALEDKYDLVFTTGGTGIGPRDITPQTTASLIDLPLPGIPQAMMNASLNVTPRGVISRAVAGLIGKCLTINLPGSPKAIAENLTVILPALEHALSKIHGDASDCGGMDELPIR